MKYVGGDIYLNSIVAAISEIIATISSNAIESCLGVRKGMKRMLYLTFLSSACLIFIPPTSSPMIFGGIIIVSKFGLCATLCMIWFTVGHAFPVKLTATVFGMCNFFGRLITTISPLISETDPPIPMIVLTSLVFLSMIVVRFFRKLGKEA
jgi:hypothetical protein